MKSIIRWFRDLGNVYTMPIRAYNSKGVVFRTHVTSLFLNPVIPNEPIIVGGEVIGIDKQGLPIVRTKLAVRPMKRC